MKPSRADLSFACSRRRLLPALLQEMVVILGSFKGGQGHRLSDLGNLSDEQLGQIRPTVNADYEILVDQGYVCGRLKRSGTTFKLFPLQRAYLAAFNLFDGRHNLSQIGLRVSQELGWDEDKGFAHARDLFLSLAQRLVCVPQNSPELDE